MIIVVRTVFHLHLDMEFSVHISHASQINSLHRERCLLIARHHRLRLTPAMQIDNLFEILPAPAENFHRLGFRILRNRTKVHRDLDIIIDVFIA